MELQGESGSDFGEVGPRAIRVELVPVVAEEDEVSLVVPGDHPSFLELGILGKEAG